MVNRDTVDTTPATEGAERLASTRPYVKLKVSVRVEKTSHHIIPHHTKTVAQQAAFEVTSHHITSHHGVMIS